jgi:hypothetical protein
MKEFVIQWIALNKGLVLTLAAIALAYAALHLVFDTKPSQVAPGELQTLVNRGQPTVLELYSNY